MVKETVAFKNLTGQRFGRLVVVRRVLSLRNCIRWECRCDCGKIIVASGHDLKKNGGTTSCGCYHREVTSKHNTKDITGQRFEKLIVIKRAPILKTKNWGVRWECRCDCGKTTIVWGNDLRNGKTKTCGCGRVESTRKRFTGKIRKRGKDSPRYGKSPTHGKRCCTLKGNIVRSSYEKIFCDWLFTHGIEYQYEPHVFDFETFTYTPDLFIPSWGVYVEIKGYWRKVWRPGRVDDRTKFDAFLEKYGNIILLEEPEIKSFNQTRRSYCSPKARTIPSGPL